VGRWANKYVIGLTGNIAVGKSVVRQMLQHLGAYTIDADGLSHQAMAPGAPAYKPVVDTFGQFILNPDKTINRGMLGNIVFSSPDALAKLEAIVHPIVGQAINTLINRAKQPIVVIEAIKLLEGELGKGVDAVWVVDAKPQTQYTRLISKKPSSASWGRMHRRKSSSRPASSSRTMATWKKPGNRFRPRGTKSPARPLSPLHLHSLPLPLHQSLRLPHHSPPPANPLHQHPPQREHLPHRPAPLRPLHRSPSPRSIRPASPCDAGCPPTPR
jgi:dephospho-CoA kinase